MYAVIGDFTIEMEIIKHITFIKTRILTNSSIS